MKIPINISLTAIIPVQFENDLDINDNGKWVDPYDSIWLKISTIIFYIVEVVASIIMLAFVAYETGGNAGHYRTLINQLLSCLYGGVRLNFTIITFLFFCIFLKVVLSQL